MAGCRVAPKVLVALSPSTCTGCSRSRLFERWEVDVVGKCLLLYEVNPGMHMVARQKNHFDAGLLFLLFKN